MIRKITITVLAALCVSVCPVFASESTKQDAQAAAQQTTTFTAESAVGYALENSLDIKAKQEKITSCELKEKADAAQRKRVNHTYERTSTAPGINDLNTFLLTSGYVEYADGVQTTIAKRTLAESKYQLKMRVENKFYSCINADKKITVAKDALDNANENASIAKEKLDAGVIGSIEAASFDLAVVAAENNYDKAQKDRDYMYSELKQLMSYPADDTIVLTGTFERQSMNTTTLETALSTLDTNANKLNLDAGLDLQEKLLARYKSLYTTSMYDYQAQKAAYAEYEAEYNSNIGQLRLAVENSYNTMVNTYNQLNYIDKAIELKEQQTEAQRTSYELGLSTASQYITAIQELDDLKLQRVDAELGAYLTSEAYTLTYHASETEN
ncbi:MAG: TolC family protein [Oscillospiraceae bacterium]|nr:TolC family protein [Oscillospiraceae bacterium]